MTRFFTDTEVGFKEPTFISDAEVGLGGEVNQENYKRIAVARIERARRKAQEAGTDLNANEQVAILDAYRFAAGLEPLSWGDSYQEFLNARAKQQGDLLNLARATSAQFQRQAVNIVSPAVDLVFPGWGTKVRRDIATLNPYDPERISGKVGGVIASAPLLLASGSPSAAAAIFGLQAGTESLATAEDLGIEGKEKWLAAAGSAAITAGTVWLGGRLGRWMSRTLGRKVPALQRLFTQQGAEGVGRIVAREAALAGISLPAHVSTLVAGRIADNLLAQQTLDPNRKWDEGLDEAAYQAAAMILAIHTARAAKQVVAPQQFHTGPLPEHVEVRRVEPIPTPVERITYQPPPGLPDLGPVGSQQNPQGVTATRVTPPAPVEPVARPQLPGRVPGTPALPERTPITPPAPPTTAITRTNYPPTTRRLPATTPIIPEAPGGRRGPWPLITPPPDVPTPPASPPPANTPGWQDRRAALPPPPKKPRGVIIPRPKSIVLDDTAINHNPPGSGPNLPQPRASYPLAINEPSQAGQNVWVRPSAAIHNRDRKLLVQFSTDLINADRPHTAADDYYAKLYAQRAGYVKPPDFWELPEWISIAARNFPNSDVYVVRNMEEARRFLAEAGYGEVAFSALDVNSRFIQQLTADYPGRVAIGGYTDMAPFQGRPNITVYDSMPAWVEARGRKFVNGKDYRHFRGTEVVPRLCLSKGCLHNCAFCGVTGKGKPPSMLSRAEVARQVESFRDLRAKLIYIDDKTFGQAKNYRDLVKIKEQIARDNPDFEGFIIQTSAAVFAKMDPQFLIDAGVRYVEIGVESYNDDILKSLRKPASTKLIDRSVQKMREAGIQLIPNVMIGLPGETPETYARTLDFLHKNADIISHVNAYNVALYEGSELAKRLGGAKTETDKDENVMSKSWHPDPALVQQFHDAVMRFGSDALDRVPFTVPDPPVGAEPPVGSGGEPPTAIEPTPGEGPPIPLAGGGGAGEGVPPAPPADPGPGFFADESGSLNLEAIGQLASGAVGNIAGAVNAITGEMAFTVGRVPAGKDLTQGLDQVSAKARLLTGVIENQAAAAYRATSAADRRWMMARDDRGYTNFQRLIEDTPSGPIREGDASEAVQEMARVYRMMLDATAREAERIGVMVTTPTGATIPFRAAGGGRYLRHLTPDAHMALVQGSGKLFDAIAAAVARDNGIELSQAETYLREWLGPPSVRKIGQLEQLRAIPNLPVAVTVGSTEVMVQEPDPFIATMHHARNQARRLYMIEEFGQGVGGEPTRIDELRAQYQRQGGDVGEFDDLIAVFEGRPYRRVFKNPRNPLARALRVFDRILASSQTSLSVVPNLPQTLILVPKYVGIKRYLQAIRDVIGDWKGTTSELVTLGAMNRAVIDFVVRPGTVPEDLARIGTGVLSRFTGLEGVSQFNNAVAGAGFKRLAEHWRSGGFDPQTDMAIARDLRLTDAEIRDLKAGRMSPLTFAKVVQNGVKITQLITEDSHRRSQLQNIPFWNSFLAYNGYAIGTFKAVARTMRETGNALKPGATPKQRLRAAYALALLVVGAGGAGTLQLLMRRGVKGQELVRPDEDALDIIGQGLWEAALLGPTQRMQDAFEYGGTTERAVIGISPKLAAAVDLIKTLRGEGTWGEFPLGERVGRAAVRQAPVVRAAETWYQRLQYPQETLYQRVRAMTGAYVRELEKAGKRAPRAEVRDIPIKPVYYNVHQAILHDDRQELDAAVTAYQTWAAEQGLDGAEARRRLRSALMARRPVNLNFPDYREYLQTLDPYRRLMVEQTQIRYTTLMDALTLTPAEAAAARGDAEAIEEALDPGTPGAVRRQLFRQAQTPPIAQEVANLNIDDALRVWDTATAAEREDLRPVLVQKYRSARNTLTPAQMNALAARLRQKGIFK